MLRNNAHSDHAIRTLLACMLQRMLDGPSCKLKYKFGHKQRTQQIIAVFLSAFLCMSLSTGCSRRDLDDSIDIHTIAPNDNLPSGIKFVRKCERSSISLTGLQQRAGVLKKCRARYKDTNTGTNCEVELFLLPTPENADRYLQDLTSGVDDTMTIYGRTVSCRTFRFAGKEAFIMYWRNGVFVIQVSGRISSRDNLIRLAKLIG